MTNKREDTDVDLRKLFVSVLEESGMHESLVEIIRKHVITATASKDGQIILGLGANIIDIDRAYLVKNIPILSSIAQRYLGVRGDVIITNALMMTPDNKSSVYEILCAGYLFDKLYEVLPAQFRFNSVEIDKKETLILKSLNDTKLKFVRDNTNFVPKPKTYPLPIHSPSHQENATPSNPVEPVRSSSSIKQTVEILKEALTRESKRYTKCMAESNSFSTHILVMQGQQADYAKMAEETHVNMVKYEKALKALE
jgi:hypothetical protein